MKTIEYELNNAPKRNFAIRRMDNLRNRNDAEGIVRRILNQYEDPTQFHRVRLYEGKKLVVDWRIDCIMQPSFSFWPLMH